MSCLKLKNLLNIALKSVEANIESLSNLNAYSLTLVLRSTLFIVIAIIAMVWCKGVPDKQSGGPGALDFAKVMSASKTMSFEESIELLRRSANTGHLGAQELLPLLLLGGPSSLQLNGESGNRTCEALLWFDRAAEQGSQLGKSYRTIVGSDELKFARKRCAPAASFLGHFD